MSEFDDAEQRLLADADETLPALAVARRATEVLAEVISTTTIPPYQGEGSESVYLRRAATFQLAVIALRTARVCMLVVSAGYMPEAMGPKRRLSEAHARAQSVAHDESGEYARQWLDGKTPKPGKSISKFGSTDLWDLYSTNTHADVRGVFVWLTQHAPDGSGVQNGIVATPRRDDLSNAMLTEVATECRDLAAVTAVCRSMVREEVRAGVQYVKDQLDDMVDNAVRTYYNELAADEAGTAT